MSPISQNSPRLRLDPMSYDELRQLVLCRDGWRCQSCGTISNLEVHHKQFRSHSGHDSEENLITMCTACHAIAHKRANKTDQARAMPHGVFVLIIN
jgi:5-methylcytosine-specific restriction endonuclease McrA